MEEELITVKQFVDREQQNLITFYRHWIDGNATNPAVFPESLSEAEMIEQYLTFLNTRQVV